jgi:hypothetical protein
MRSSVRFPVRRFWWVLPIVLMGILGACYWMQQSRALVLAWHDPRVRVEILEVSKGFVHTASYPGGISGKLHQILSRIGLSWPGSTIIAPTMRTPKSESVLWFAVIPTKGTLTPDRDRVTLIRPNGRRTSWSQTRGQFVKQGEVYFMNFGIAEGIDAVKGSTVELTVGWRKRAVIQIR